MRRLILFRHGKAEAASPTGQDIDRHLAARGVREATDVGKRLAGLGIAPDLALGAPAARTYETWAAAQGELPPAAVIIEPGLYNAESEVIRQLAEEAGAKAQTVVVVAHNPGLHELAVRLLAASGSEKASLQKVYSQFPPATVAVFAFKTDGKVVFEHLLYPDRS